MYRAEPGSTPIVIIAFGDTIRGVDPRRAAALLADTMVFAGEQTVIASLGEAVAHALADGRVLWKNNYPVALAAEGTR